jgi:hypothetical protein
MFRDLISCGIAVATPPFAVSNKDHIDVRLSTSL